MRLLVELAAERSLAAVINIHDVPLAQMFAQRIVGLREGRIVYDGPPSALHADALTAIYGEEDWSHEAAEDENAAHDRPRAPRPPLVHRDKARSA
jgi:phosphonate transport system ATP-binding protein